MRGFGVAAVLCPQLAEGMGGPEAAARIIGSAQTILLHAMATPERFVHAGGSRRVYRDHPPTRGRRAHRRSARPASNASYRVDPSEVRRLAVGQCFAIGSGLAMKLQIAAAPSGKGEPTRAAGAAAQAAEARPERAPLDALRPAPRPVGLDKLERAPRPEAASPRRVRADRAGAAAPAEPAGPPAAEPTAFASTPEPTDLPAAAPAPARSEPREDSALNSIRLVGRLTERPKLETTVTGKRRCRMRLAVPGFNRDATPVFIDLEAWNALAERCEAALESGRRIAVSGLIAQDQWQTSEGQKRQRHYVVAESIELLDPREGPRRAAAPRLEERASP